VPCPTGQANVSSVACKAAACAVGACNPGYEDVDGQLANGCEQRNPLSIQPADLTLWLRSDVGVTYDASGVSQWADQSGTHNNATQATSALRPSVSSGLWPGRPSLSVLKFNGSTELDVNLSTFASANGFTLLIAEARDTSSYGQFIGAGTYVAGPGCCTGDQGKLFSLAYGNNNTYVLERTCLVLAPSVPGGTGYQPRQSAVWFDTQFHITFGNSSTIVADETGVPGFACSGTRPSAATMGSNGTIGNSPDQARYHGLIGEIILYKRVLLDSELSVLRAYLAAKWGT
jgi:hypothetical protein